MEKIQFTKHLVDQEVANLLAVKILGEFWIDNSLFWVIYDANKRWQSDQKLDFSFSEGSGYCSVVGQIRVGEKNYSIVEVEGLLMDTEYNPYNLLSERELQIATLTAQGMSNKQMANLLQISEWTIATHIRRIFIKLRVDSRAAMVYYCASLIRFRLQKY
ncbi:MAG: helix-turn-helix transcriptional regulator [Xenococcaceae cyanobacterium MO_167.B52]|nr:helix-turn-helix transcriptional regulator [Xenococcaceae cyanobacterium MO_167.B52]